MTKDDFRRYQKPLCVSGAPNKMGIYGCSCCRKVSDLGDFKKFARHAAKVRLRRETRREIANEIGG